MSDTSAPEPTIFDEILSVVTDENLRNHMLNQLNDAFRLISENNTDVYAVREAKNSDPASADYQDVVWRREADRQNKKVLAEARKYWAAEEAMKASLEKLRAMAPEFMGPVLDKDAADKLKQKINQNRENVELSRKLAGVSAGFADMTLAALGKPVEGGILSLMPNIETLLNTRGKGKSHDVPNGISPHMTRVPFAKVNGKEVWSSVRGENKCSFPILAAFISNELSNGKNIPENIIIAEDLEGLYYDQAGITFRELDKRPDVFEMKLDRMIFVQNTNDDSKTEVQQVLTIEIHKSAPKDEASTPAAE